MTKDRPSDTSSELWLKYAIAQTLEHVQRRLVERFYLSILKHQRGKVGETISLATS